MRLRAQSYHNLDGTQYERAAASVPWFWRAITIASSAMIVGGFLMLPVSFEREPQLRISPVAISIFALAVLIAGFCATALVCVVVPSLPYRADAVLMPALISCVIGFLTVFYNMLISTRYQWNVFSILILVVSGVAAVAYGTLLFFTNRKISRTRTAPPGTQPGSRLGDDVPQPLTEISRWQSPQYYQNYVKNMFPSASYEPHSVAHESPVITEEELQRQQMLMLLLNQDSGTQVDSSSNTFRIEWQGQDQEPNTPVHGYFGTSSNRPSAHGQSAQQMPTSARVQLPGQIRPWDGVWRGIASHSSMSQSLDPREARRREIELGR